MKLRFTNILPILLSLLACISCVNDKYGECLGDDDIVLPDGKQYVNLDLRIDLNDGIAPSSRAEDDGYGEFDDYELPLNAYEKVHTLRVVIVRADGTIEHNRMVNIKDNYDQDENGAVITSGDIINDNLQFKVVTGEDKTIYLFANERAVNNNKTGDEIFDFHSSLAVGMTFPTEEVANILIKREPGKAFIDNNGDGVKTYVPMSECFTIHIDDFEDIQSDVTINASGVAEKYLTETLFITRSLIKFSFTVRLKATGIASTQLSLSGVRISDLANEGYYLPNNAVYDPDRYKPSTNNLGGRKIVSFKVPYEDEANLNKEEVFSDCTFLFDEPLPISSEAVGSLPKIYLPESKTIDETSYMVTLLFTDGENYYESKALDIKYIPRNTHVKVNMTLNSTSLKATVAIVPYISVVLNPIFGFEEINPGQKKPEGEE